MTARVVLFNGPPKSGKDTAASHVFFKRTAAARMKFSDPVKNGTHSSYGLWGLPPNAFEYVKDEPREEFLGMTPRNAYIAHSERYMKVLHGNDVYGRIAVNCLPPDGVVLFPDSGFHEEAEPVIDAVGPQNVLLIRLLRDGCDFDHDSRSYLTLACVQTYNVYNGDIDEFLAEILRITDNFCQT